ncbi:hypothetical protein E4U53_005531 [Claviceps sorghi]|nr:hypothetical protein E4U53_005531 [Claviceps sorghi]
MAGRRETAPLDGPRVVNEIRHKQSCPREETTRSEYSGVDEVQASGYAWSDPKPESLFPALPTEN